MREGRQDERRSGDRRQTERRKTERRQDIASPPPSSGERRVNERRAGDRRKSDRRLQGIPLSEKAKMLGAGPHIAILSTTLPDGSIQTHPMWCGVEGDHILLNTEIHRPKFKNIQRNPAVTVLLMENGNHFSWCEIRGRVVETVGGQEARDHIDQLSGVYLDNPNYPNPIQSERVILKVAAVREITA